MSYSKRSLSIIVPIYNEAEMLPTVLPALLEYCGLNGFKLILVNDGSKDGSLSIMNKMCTDINFVCIINHKLNRGYGAAIKSGIEICETEFAITIDADGQHFLEDIDKLYNKCISE
ncbi:MAG: glycosyltransferase family 2 protein, partial [Candidatus Cloacimonetes bacterium]|nr:glycosyltransferase family 2 protein [Candidatus Cloacimonadota bacterium]